MEIGKIWAENVFVTRGNIIHERVHDASLKTYQKGGKQIRGVTVYSDKLGIYGAVDCIELKKSPNGALIDGEKYSLKIVEYKPRKPKDKEYNIEDALQVFAQMVCLEETFGTQCECEIYYALEKTKVKLPFAEHYQDFMQLLNDTLAEIRNHLENETIPSIRSNQRCSGCSLKDLCMPKLKKQTNVQSRILNMLEDEK